MTRTVKSISRALAAIALSAAASAGAAEERVDLAVVHRIKAEAFKHSRVMDHLFWLADANGPRLTNSPGLRTAADWAVKTLSGWGASGAKLEPWGTFGRGWQLNRFSAAMVAPVYAPLNGVPKAWCGSTPGPVSGEIVIAPFWRPRDREDRMDLDRTAARLRSYADEHRGKLRGKFVLMGPSTERRREPEPARYDEAKLSAMKLAPEPAPLPELEWPLRRLPADFRKLFSAMSNIHPEILRDFFDKRRKLQLELWSFLAQEGVLGVLEADARGRDAGLVFVESTGAWGKDAPVPPPAVVLAPEQYGRMVRLTEKKVPVKIALDLQAQMLTDSTEGYNVVAELPGGDKRDEVVILGAHLDSWHGGTGATDNAAGSAVMLEAFRILKALGLKMDRTVRIALWSGEEQGLYGSRNYVKNHFGDSATMQLKPEHAKVAAYFNVDNGSGKIRGVYLQQNDQARPIFEKWLEPLRDLGATTVTIRNTGGTDHQSFDAVGLPGFQFVQDPLEYQSRTHHSAIDVVDHVSAGDLMQAAAVVASFAYHAATRPEMLPRKPLPPPLPPPTKKEPPGAPAVGGR